MASFGLIFGLELDAETRSDPVDEIEIGNDRRDVMDSVIRQPLSPQPVDIGLFDRVRRGCQLDGEVDQYPLFLDDRGRTRVRRNRLDQFVVMRERTENLSVMTDSIVTMVD